MGKKVQKVVPLPKIATLTPAQLQEFRARQMVVTVTRGQYDMVKEAYETWLTRTVKGHGIKGKFDLDPRTGVIKEKRGDG